MQAVNDQFPREPKGNNQSSKPETLTQPLELRLAVRNAMFRMDHHPLEVQKTLVKCS